MRLDIVSLSILDVILENDNRLSIPVLDRKHRDKLGLDLSYSMSFSLSKKLDELQGLGLFEEKPLYKLTEKGRKLLNKEAKRWIEAGVTIATDKNAKVLCPECQADYLAILDMEITDFEHLFDRHMACKKCGASNVLSMKK